MDVSVVPMLAPMSMGIAVAMGRPPATRPTVMDVTVDDDWMSAVASTPIIRAMSGLDAKANSSSACPPVAALKPSPMTLTAVMSR